MHKRYTLVVDRSGNPIDIVGYEDCFRLLAKGNAIVIDTVPAKGEEYATFKWVKSLDEWFSLPHSDQYIPTSTSTVHVPTPEVIVLTEAEKGDIKRKRVQFNKENLLIRDDFACGYCGTDLSYSTCTIDHVVPRSKGGGTSWENCVSACRKCNFDKLSHDPVGRWKPNHELYEPKAQSRKFNEVYKKIRRMHWYPMSWDYYLKK